MTKKIKIASFVTSRSEYFPAKKLFLNINKDPSFDFSLFVAGSLLKKKYGNMANEINNLDINVLSFDFLIPKKTIESFHTSISNLVKKTSIFLKSKKIDYLIIIGDRYESFIFSLIAKTYQIEIIHLSGGEETLGSLDNVYRNAISNLSSIHFPSLPKYKKKLLDFGINKQNIFTVGDIGLSYLDDCNYLKKTEIEKILGFKFQKKNILVTYHPNSKNTNKTKDEINILLSTLKKLKKVGIILTYSNTDYGHDYVNNLIEKFSKKNIYSITVKSLGDEIYRSVLKNIDLVVGNSSSGIWEVPSYKIPTLNIGDRQKGRFKSKSIYDCNFDNKIIFSKINKLMSVNYKNKFSKFKNPYYQKETISKIINIIKFKIFDY